jgi:hypothetical protein
MGDEEDLIRGLDNNNKPKVAIKFYRRYRRVINPVIIGAMLLGILLIIFSERILVELQMSDPTLTYNFAGLGFFMITGSIIIYLALNQ